MLVINAGIVRGCHALASDDEFGNCLALHWLSRPRCRVFDIVGHETQRYHRRLIVVNDFLIWHDTCCAIPKRAAGRIQEKSS